MDEENVEKERNAENAEEQSTTKEDAGDLIYWRNQSQHIIHFLLYILDWNGLGILQFEDGVKPIEYEPNIVHYFVMTIVVGGPLVFLHTFIGQYAQNGFFAFGSMLPLFYGLGFVMIIYSYLRLTIQIYYACFLLYYFFTSCYNARIPWVTCFDSVHYPIDCFSKSDFDLCPTMENSNESCFEPGTKVLAAFYFMWYLNWYLGLSGGKPISFLDSPQISNQKAVIYAMFHGFLVFVVLLIMSTRVFRNLDATLRISFYLCVAGNLFLVVVGLTRPGSFYYLLTQIPSIINPKSITSLDVSIASAIHFVTWSASFRRTIEALKIADGGIIMFGSFMSHSDLSPYRSCKLSTAFFLTALFCTFYYKVYANNMFFKIGLTMEQLNMASEESVVFALYPTILGLQAFGRVFCFLYFLFVMIINFCSMALRVVVIEKALALHFNISSHYPYTRFFICLGGYLTVFSFFIPINSDELYNVLGRLKLFMIVTVGLQMTVVHLYGLQRLCDDIQFYHRQIVANFTKTCWILIPILCLEKFREKFIFKTPRSHDTLIKILMLCALVFPLAVGFVYMVVDMAKKKNLIGLLRPLDKFGPRDIQLRIRRLLYNPRLSEKYVSSECNHVCLLQSEALEMAIQEEITAITRLIDELEKSEEVTAETKNLMIIRILKKHVEIWKWKGKG